MSVVSAFVASHPDAIVVMKSHSTVQQAWLAMPYEMHHAFEHHRMACQFEYDYENGRLYYHVNSVGSYKIEDMEQYT